MREHHDYENGEQTKRTLGALIVFALTGVAGGVLALLAFALSVDPETLSVVTDTVQPGTIIVAVISALGGLAAGAGLKEH